MAGEIRNYSDIYNIKDWMSKEYAPKHFNLDANRFNAGLLGYTTEIAAVTTEDSFLAMNVHMKEMFISQASRPETISTYAAQLDIEGEVANPSELYFVIMVKKSDIHQYGIPVPGTTRRVFSIDKMCRIMIEDKQYMLDYDIHIDVVPYRGDYTYTSRYDIEYKNSLSDIRVPYLVTIPRMLVSNTEYVGIEVKLRQINREIHLENVLSVDRINFSSIELNHEDQFAGIDVLYREVGNTSYIPLRKRIKDSTAVKEPFFFFRIIDESTIEISFSSQDKYFRPEFNSELLITVYTTKGSSANFKEFTGRPSFATESEKWNYLNGDVILWGVPNGSSKHGMDRRTLEDIRDATIEKQATCGVYNTEEDLQLYFRNYGRRSKNFLLFLKRRDDLRERLFSAFSLMKNSKGDFYRTNSLSLMMTPDDFDHNDDATKTSVLKPGRIFKYASADDRGMAIPLDKSIRSENLPPFDVNKDFTYTNPFLMIYTRKPSSMGFYMNSVKQEANVSFKKASIYTKTTFTCNIISVDRNAIAGEDTYRVELTVRPSDIMELKPNTSEPVILDRMKVFTVFTEKNIETFGYQMEYTGFDVENNLIRFHVNIPTTDLISNGRMEVIDAYNIRTGVKDPLAMVEMFNTIMNINIFLKGEGEDGQHSLSLVDDLAQYTLVNRYDTSDDPMNFIIPMMYMMSRSRYIPPTGSDPSEYSIKFDKIPFLCAADAKELDETIAFMKEIEYVQDFLQDIVDKKTTNYHIDLKFYNTYGKANNFTADESQILLDRTNISLHYSINPAVGVNMEELVRDIKTDIKNYVEDINNNKSSSIDKQGYNAFYNSTVIKDIQTKYAAESVYMKFFSINDYPSNVQIIENRTDTEMQRDYENPLWYVPEYLSIRPEDIRIDIITR